MKLVCNILEINTSLGKGCIVAYKSKRYVTERVNGGLWSWRRQRNYVGAGKFGGLCAMTIIPVRISLEQSVVDKMEKENSLAKTIWKGNSPPFLLWMVLACTGEWLDFLVTCEGPLTPVLETCNNKYCQEASYDYLTLNNM